MPSKPELAILALVAVSALIFTACGPEPPPKDAEDEDVDLIGSIVGEVEVEEEDLEAVEEPDEVYTGPTKATINLRVVNETNPEGSYTLTDTTGAKIIENGEFGKEIEINQGLYQAAFKSPLVLGDPVYETEIEVAGRKQEIKEVFPAGQLTLHTYKKDPKGPCKAVTFSVRNTSGNEPVDVPGKGKTCKPVILQTGSYEILLDISKKKVQPVAAKVNAEQVATAPVKLEKK
jgi:hypothetical protein